ncbi:hypothetical protein JT359_17470 [Candidatus Poribacteria bacterium]|nr:hypothetical protein [Candidatus Poribacteria bacterium]
MPSNKDTGEMVNGKKHGYWITYYASGIKRSEGNYVNGDKDGLWINYYKNGSKSGEASFRNGKHEGDCITYYENGNLRSKGTYPQHVGKSYDGKKEGVWFNYEDDGETVWLIVTYKRGGSRAKPDEYPLGKCDVCGDPKRITWEDSCPRCGTEIDELY